MTIDNDQQRPTPPAIAGQGERGGITDQQERFITECLTGTSEVAAIATSMTAKEAQTTLQSKAVRRSMHEARSVKIRTDGANKALRTLIELMDASQPPAVRLGAARFMAELAGHTGEAEASERRGVGEMSAAELQDFIAQADRQLERIGDAARPVTTLKPS